MNTPMYHLPACPGIDGELQGRLGGNPREMRPSTISRTYGVNSAVVNALHGVNPVQLGREDRKGGKIRK